MCEAVIIVLEIVGTITFAISGALIAISCSLDIFGVTFIGVITAVVGGILRDVLVGESIPLIFYNSYVFVIAAVTAIIVFIIAYINRLHFKELKEKIEHINNIFDAAGLSAFTVTGTEVAFEAGFSDKILFVILMGMITGVGGGILRDVLVLKTPYVLKKHIYALASVFGSSVYYLMRIYVDGNITGTVVSMLSVFIIRVMATKFRWKLPKIQL